MGFAAIAELTHEMEDVFELLRQRAGGLEPGGGRRACSPASTRSRRRSSRSRPTAARSSIPQPLIERLRQLVRDRTPEQALERAGGAEIPDIAALEAAREAGARVLHVVATLDDEVLMPAVRAHMLFAALADYGEMIGSVPSPEGVEHFDGREIEALARQPTTTRSDVAQAARSGIATSSQRSCATDTELTPTAAAGPRSPSRAPTPSSDRPARAGAPTRRRPRRLAGTRRRGAPPAGRPAPSASTPSGSTR